MHQKLAGIHQPEIRGVLIQSGLDAESVFPQPALVRLSGLETLINVLGVQDFTGLCVDRQHLTRSDTAFGYHIVRLITVSSDL